MVTTSRHPASRRDIALVARRYYLDGKAKNEIADELGLSRFKIARMLEEAREFGIVHISIDLAADDDVELGQRVAERFGLRRAVVIDIGDADELSATRAVGNAAAEVVEGLVHPGEVLGLAWGRVLTSMADALERRSGVDVVQLVGGVRASGAGVAGVELVRRVAECTGGHAFPLHAPLIVGSPEMAQQLRADPSLADAVGRFAEVSVAVVGVGSWEIGSSALVDELGDAERRALADAGAVADICGIVVDRAGAPVDASPAERTIGIRLDELRRVPEIVAVAAGRDKAGAIRAALRGGFVTTLVTDAATAEALLS